MNNWNNFKNNFLDFSSLGISLDFSNLGWDVDYVEKSQLMLEKGLSDLDFIEAGGIANPSENRMVGHYWLRNSALASSDIATEIDNLLIDIKGFVKKIHSEGRFKHLLLVGIGGSALGPQFINHALAKLSDPMKLYVMDNTDPIGFKKIIDSIPDLAKTLVLVVSKSGGTPETANGKIYVQDCFKKGGLNFTEQAVAITGLGSKLFQEAKDWLKIFPMWDWVGGRTSIWSAVGLVHQSLQGWNIEALLNGAKEADILGRNRDLKANPSLALALAWYYAGEGKGNKDMVVIPYRDRLELCSKYLQQLIMESLGKAQDLSGNTVEQGISVFGNKGSTDQHAYIQQLRDGKNNFFATFIEVLENFDREFVWDIDVRETDTASDFLNGFLLGTTKALTDNNRKNITISLQRTDEFHLGALIAIYERAVSFYASFVGINAYDQPGVEAGKKAAEEVLHVKNRITELLATKSKLTVEQIAQDLNADPVVCFRILRHLQANKRIKARVVSDFKTEYSLS